MGPAAADRAQFTVCLRRKFGEVAAVTQRPVRSSQLSLNTGHSPRPSSSFPPLGRSVSRGTCGSPLDFPLGSRCAGIPASRAPRGLDGSSMASVEPIEGDGTELPSNGGQPDRTKALPEKSAIQTDVTESDVPAPGGNEQNNQQLGATSAAGYPRNARASIPRLGSGTVAPFPTGTRREQLRRSLSMRYDRHEKLTKMQRMWMILDDPSFSRGAPRPSLAARAARSSPNAPPPPHPSHIRPFALLLSRQAPSYTPSCH